MAMRVKKDSSHIAREDNRGRNDAWRTVFYGMMLESANECAWGDRRACGRRQYGQVRGKDEWPRQRELVLLPVHIFANPNGGIPTPWIDYVSA